MACELFECCQFFTENMKELPRAAEYIKERVCFGDHESCSRYRIYQHGAEAMSWYLDRDAEAMRKMTRCLRDKKLLR